MDGIFAYDRGGVQPRLGVAWNVGKGTVIRAGGGIFFAKTMTSTISSGRRSSGTREAQVTCFPSTEAKSPACQSAAGQILTFPDVLFSQDALPQGPAFSGPGVVPLQTLVPNVATLCTGPVTRTACSERGIDPADDRPRAYEAEVGIERQVPGNLDLSASYVFTRGAKLPSHYDANLAPPTTKSYDVQTTTGGPFEAVTVPFFTQRLDPTVGAILEEASVVNSTYSAH